MEKLEAKEIFDLLGTAYSSFLPKTENEYKAKVNLWKRFLVKWDYDKTMEKVVKHIETNQFEPKIADIKPHVPQPKFDWQGQMQKEGIKFDRE